MAISKASSNAVAPAAKGDLVVGNATNDSGVLAVGSTDQVLTVDSSTATGLKWATASAGGLTLISSTTLSAVSSLTLSSIPGTYKHLYLEWFGVVHSTANNVFGMRFNNDSSALYSSMISVINNSTAASATELNQTSINCDENQPFGNNANGNTAVKNVDGTMIIYDYASTSLFKRFYYQSRFFHVSGDRNVNSFVKGVYGSTSAITQLNVIQIAGSGTLSNSANTAVRLWGMS